MIINTESEGRRELRVRTLLFGIDSQLKPTSIIRCVRREFGDQVVLFSQATGTVSSGNLPAFDVIGSRAGEIAGDGIVTNVVHDHTVIQVQNFVTKAPSRLTQLIIAVTHNTGVSEYHQCKLGTVVQKFTKYKR